MNSNELIQGSTLMLEVNKDACDRKKFRVKAPDGNEYNILKYKFQYDEPLPDFLQCYVKQLSPSVILAQDISIHINKFYETGNDYDFNVIGFKKDPYPQYDLKDNNGLCFKLNNPSLNLNKGDRIKCKISKIKDANVTLQYVGTLSPELPLEFYDIKKWLTELRINSKPELYLDWLNRIPEFAPAMQKYEDRNPTWILDALQICTKRIPQWLIECRDNLPMLRNIKRKLALATKLSLYILEESDYLRNCNQEQRNSLQSKLSYFTDLFDQYDDATNIILANTHEQFIAKMFRRLKEAGYLYQPKRQIRIMMTILKLRPELINRLMGELFETLHNWNINNWLSEPFREALVQQLEIFIEENYGKVNLVALNDTSSDNRVVSRLILALAVQRLLASEKDDIELNLNRAILYRYTSYLIPDDTTILLQNAIDALLGFDWNNEFSWEDTENPSILFNKTCNLRKIDDEEIITKTFTTSKVSVQLSRDKLHIIANSADPEQTVIPNNLFDWLEPTISLTEPLNINIGKKSKQQLRDYRKMWDEIRTSLFSQNEVADIKLQSKRLPSQDDEVNVVIDDMRILDEGHEKQRLQFHCTIHDDIFYGDGWMPCDNFHMVPWLTFKDIPNNYNGSLAFARSENGSPLLFKAKVSYHNGVIDFSLKDEIDNKLIDSNWPGLESTGIVISIDKGNNCWICLTENGASYKLPYDSSTEDLSVGKIVRLTYLERDLSNLLSPFFIGVLSENQNDLPSLFNKNIALYNLMQSIGEAIDESEDFEVVESQQLMTYEELVELIYILRRRAYWETEYDKAYNYLGLASILVRIADEPTLLKEITIHMELLELLQEFGKNNKIEYQVLEKYDSKLDQSPMLERLFTRLKLVSELGNNENSKWLWEKSQDPRNETEGVLASLVLSYNILPRNMEESKKQILDQISTVLKVNSVNNTSKYYGDESQKTEFKSSLVYSAKKGSKPAVKEQLWEITHIICGFMNARGGTLYIGVNDSGYENGLDDDLTYRKRMGQKATIDAMMVDLQNHLDKSLPIHAKDHWEIIADPESKKGVIMVKIDPVLEPVELEGVIYVRSSSSTKPRLNEERDEFIRNRRLNYENILRQLKGNDDASQSNRKENISELATSNLQSFDEQNSLEVKTDVQTSDKEEFKKKKVKTGHYRFNVLHSHEDEFVEPSFYIYFNSDNTLNISQTDYYREEDIDCELVLAVKERELEGFLIITYEDNRVSIIPMEAIKELNNEQKYKIRQNVSLKYINIASESDSLLTIVKNHSGSIFYRIEPLQTLTSNDREHEGELLFQLPHTIIWQDIVTQKKRNFFDVEAFEKDAKTLGCSVPIGDGTLSHEERISNLLNPILLEKV